MALINLLPSVVKKTKHIEKTKAKPAAATVSPPDISFLRPVLIIALVFLGILTALFIQAALKEKVVSSLKQKVQELKSNYRKIDELNKKRGESVDILSFLQGASNTDFLWSEKLGLINKLLPSQLWLTNISVESTLLKTEPASRSTQVKTKELKPRVVKTLVIKGSATSLIEADIISAITQFVTLLKKDAGFSKDFGDIKLGPLQSSNKGNLIIMNFVVYCKSDK